MFLHGTVLVLALDNKDLDVVNEALAPSNFSPIFTPKKVSVQSKVSFISLVLDLDSSSCTAVKESLLHHWRLALQMLCHC